ncbi:DUF3742 family protein [Pseudomonas sp. NPDC089422]|uniref:DUF3742 family protein n=1 Tax=Pseudomonas sp. NPDC089422 TaxID=3364466 RepID=UPI003803F3F5
MKQRKRMSITERLGRWTGRAWRGYVGREAKAHQWLQSKGAPVLLTRIFLWLIKLAVLGALSYASFWLALLTVSVLIVVRIATVNRWGAEDGWAIGEQRDHKDSMFYDPVAHNDTTDPRYEDE